MGDSSAEGLAATRGIDETIAELPGLEGLMMIEDYLNAAWRRVAQRPGWAGVAPMPGRREPSTGGTAEHWPPPEDTSRDDASEEQPAGSWS